jgi:tRNA modification GTPase
MFVDENGQTIDQVVALVFRNPNSYTGEDVIELSCHGGLLVTRTLLGSLLRFGARQAEPGEFTKRAFLNGKIDLAQAEAVADLIHARSAAAYRSSLHQLQGNLSQQINRIKDHLMEALGLLELELDFAEEGYELIDKEKVRAEIDKVLQEIDRLIDSYQMGRVYREGVKIVLAGAPNVGKSSLLNALLQENRAIVTEIPGTTRDIIEENLSIGGILFTITDTAGIREATDLVEKEGIRRTQERVATGDIVLFLIDSSEPISAEQIEQAREISQKVRQRGGNCILVLNKTDLGESAEFIANGVKELAGIPVILVSAKTHAGLDVLKNELLQVVLQGGGGYQDGAVVVTNARHYSALIRSKESLTKASSSLSQQLSGEFIALDLRGALDSLGEIAGNVTTDDILNRIFARFCIGK